MDIIARHPRPDSDYQKCFEAQLLIAKCRISQFKLIGEIFDNFKMYNSESYHKCHNFILRSCIGHYPLYKPDLETLDLLEKGLEFRNTIGFPRDYFRQFKNRITSDTYSNSRSAFQEITIMYKTGLAVGAKNVVFEANIPTSGRNSDICVSLNAGRDIYLEITSINRSQTEKKLQEIFDDASQYLYDKIPKKGHQISMMYVDTTKLVHDSNGNIDTECSVTMLHTIIDQICIDQLSNTPLNLCTPDKQRLAVISMKKIRGPSSVYIQSDTMYYSPPMPDDPVAYVHENASLCAIQRKVRCKAERHQYESGHPAILVIYWYPYIRDYESNDNDFSYI